eukprot:scaffold147131_cov32-Tisochrysis_lutea.AAC.3
MGADAQHTGIGRRLMAEAEATARAHSYRRVAVIAGVGSRGYYRKLGYELHPGDGQFMIKSINFFAPGWLHVFIPPAEALRSLAIVVSILLVLLLLSIRPCTYGAEVIGCILGGELHWAKYQVWRVRAAVEQKAHTVRDGEGICAEVILNHRLGMCETCCLGQLLSADGARQVGSRTLKLKLRLRSLKTLDLVEGREVCGVQRQEPCSRLTLQLALLPIHPMGLRLEGQGGPC